MKRTFTLIVCVLICSIAGAQIDVEKAQKKIGSFLDRLTEKTLSALDKACETVGVDEKTNDSNRSGTHSLTSTPVNHGTSTELPQSKAATTGGNIPSRNANKSGNTNK